MRTSSLRARHPSSPRDAVRLLAAIVLTAGRRDGALTGPAEPPVAPSASTGRLAPDSAALDLGAAAPTPLVASGGLIRVVGPTRVVVANTWSATAARATVTIPTPGIYTIVVATNDYGHDAAGTYRLAVSR
ncbi:MAG: hypothetical protein JO180_02695 [Gemmatirosa sp.]|nr:hypothetical protein [Gemmatirosa sp.]